MGNAAKNIDKKLARTVNCNFFYVANKSTGYRQTKPCCKVEHVLFCILYLSVYG